LQPYHLKTRERTSSGLGRRRADFLLFSSLLTLSAVYAAPTIAASDGLDLLAHRAVYELTLIDSERDSGIDFASGLFIFEVTGASCTGWTMASDMILSIEGRSGNTIRTQTSYRAFEDGAGQVFTFQTNTETNEEEPISVTGAAEREPAGNLTIRRFAEEETTTAAMAETLFPNQLTEAVMRAALAEERLVFTSVFDGSHETGLAQPVTAIIGEAAAPTVLGPVRANADGDRQIDEDHADRPESWDDFPAPTRAWPVTLSYFDPVEPDSGPSFVVSYALDTNGVSDQLILDYGSFSLRGVLADFEAFRPSACVE
jgi:hypothetical protein